MSIDGVLDMTLEEFNLWTAYYNIKHRKKEAKKYGR
jgi:hypothetical protein